MISVQFGCSWKVSRWCIDLQPLAAFAEERILYRCLRVREISLYGGPLIFGTKEALDTDSVVGTRTPEIPVSRSFASDTPLFFGSFKNSRLFKPAFISANTADTAAT